MAYVDYEYYTALYGNIDEPVFNRLLWDSERKLDVFTTGVDNYKKLRNSFPTAPEEAEAVKRCVCKLIDAMHQLEKAERTASRVTSENGTHSGVISSVSAGNESISYATGAMTEIDKALTDRSARDKMYADIIRDCLSGVTDANGINLLYMGAYPVKG